MRTRHLKLALVLCLAPTALPAQTKKEWLQRLESSWKTLRKIDLSDDRGTGQERPSFLRPEEMRHAYKIHGRDGSVAYAKRPPKSNERVHRAFKKTKAKQSFYRYGRNERSYTHVWVEITWIEEDRNWVAGYSRTHRWQRDDKTFRAWFSVAAHPPGVPSKFSMRQLQWAGRELASIQTQRRNMQNYAHNRTYVDQSRQRIASARERVRKELGKLREELVKAGKKLRCGEALWDCVVLHLELIQLREDHAAAEGKARTLAAMARSNANKRGAAESAQREASNLTRQIIDLRRQRRRTVGQVMRALRKSR